MAEDKVQLPEVIGLPPGGSTTTDVILESMPQARITPCVPHATTSMTVFTLKSETGKYIELLKAHGYTMKEGPLRVAFLADNFPTDSFTNEYGESFLNKMTDVASGGIGELSQMMGKDSAFKALKEIGGTVKDMGKEVGGITGSVLGAVGSLGAGAGSLGTKAENYIASKEGIIGMGGEALKLVGKMIAGQRVDFPQVWKNSGFQPSYTMTIRLWNPEPGNAKATNKYIIGPICALMLLGIPQTDDGNTYKWPFLHKIRADGIYNLDPAYISNITVIKGGDQQSIAWNQALGMVDVRIEFGSLYNSMIAGMKYGEKNRPNLENYLEALKVPKDKNVRKGIMYRDDLNSSVNTAIEENTTEKNLAGSQPTTDPDTTIIATARVAADDKAEEVDHKQKAKDQGVDVDIKINF